MLKRPLIKQVKRISITGTGVVKAKPDRAVLRLSVITQADTAKKAFSENANKMNSVVNAIKIMGIPESQIETLWYNLSPIWKNPKEESPKIVGYICSNIIRVTIHDLNMVGEIIDAAVVAGANEIVSLQFTISDEAMRQLRLDALSQAVKDAASKASTIATAAGLTLIGPVSIGTSEYYPSVSGETTGITRGVVPTPALPPEEISITLSISAIYEFK